MVHRFLLCVFVMFAFFCEKTGAQTPLIDSLKKKISLTDLSAKRLDAILALCEYRQSLHADTLSYYATIARKIATDLNEKTKLELADFFIANSLSRKGELEKSREITDESLQKLSYKNNKNAYVKFCLQQGQLFMRENKYKEALEVFFKLLTESEEEHDTLAQINAKNNIGWVNMEMGRNAVAIEWFYKTLSTPHSVTPDYFSVVYSNMAASYNELNKNDSAEYFVKKAVALNRQKMNNLQFMANALAIEADIFIDTKRAHLAEVPLNEVVAIRKLIGEPFYIVSDMMQLALYYSSINQPQKGIVQCNEGIAMARKFGLDAKLPILYGALAENYKAAGNYQKYAETLQQVIALKDSLYEKNSAESLVELQTRYNFQKVQNTIIKQQLDITKKDYDLTRKNYLLYGSALITFLLLVTAYFIFKNYRRKQKMRMELLLQNQKNKATMEVVEAKETERKRIAADLHDNLGAYAASIASNIDHIKILSTDAATEKAIQELRNNSQAIVSQLNDTIWVMKKDALSLTAISDRLKIFIQRMQSSYPHLKMDVIEKINEDHLLPPSHAFHLFQVLQEAINNAVRHSGGNQVTVSIESNGSWKITISDNGKGFEGSPDKEGNGLSNMKNRAIESGWNIQWQSELPGGTTVIISPTTN